MRSTVPVSAEEAVKPFGFEFVPFEIADLIKLECDEDLPDAIDYGRLQAAIKRDRNWYR